MIELNFKLNKDTAGPSGPNPDLWVDECQLAAFEGIQVIVVDNLDLSGSLPILGFARFLKGLVKDFTSAKEYQATYRDLSSEWTLDFLLNGDKVTVADHRGQATVLLSEFEEATNIYAEKVWSACCAHFPKILENEYVVEWWNNNAYSVLNYEPKKTDRRTLTPFNKFYENPEDPK